MEANRYQSLNQAGDSLLKTIIQTSNSNNNIFISSLSIATAFSMLNEGLDHQSQIKVSQFFGFDTQQSLSQNCLKEIFKVFSGSNGAIFNFANSLWTNKQNGLAIKNDYKAQVQKKYQAVLDQVNPSDGHNVINKWIEEQTNGKIKNCVNPLDSNFLMALVNAIYFKGSWANKFDERKTKLEDFYLTQNSTKKVDFMKGKKKLGFLKKEGAAYLSMGYQGTNMKFVIGLPDKHGDFEAISLEEVTNMVNIGETEVNVSIPKFKIEFKSFLKPILASQGLGFLFTPGTHFKKITDDPNAAIDEVIHQSFLQVDEEGTEAAAATVITMRSRCLRIEPSFVANKPFKFFIIDGDSGMITFSGILRNPSFE